MYFYLSTTSVATAAVLHHRPAWPTPHDVVPRSLILRLYTPALSADNPYDSTCTDHPFCVLMTPNAGSYILPHLQAESFGTFPARESLSIPDIAQHCRDLPVGEPFTLSSSMPALLDELYTASRTFTAKHGLIISDYSMWRLTSAEQFSVQTQPWAQQIIYAPHVSTDSSSVAALEPETPYFFHMSLASGAIATLLSTPILNPKQPAHILGCVPWGSKVDTQDAKLSVSWQSSLLPPTQQEYMAVENAVHLWMSNHRN